MKYLNPKALQLIIGMQDLHLIRITKEPISKLRSYTKKTSLKEPSENDELMWNELSLENFFKGYGENEPEYTEADIKEPNPEFKAWKGK